MYLPDGFTEVDTKFTKSLIQLDHTLLSQFLVC